VLVPWNNRHSTAFWATGNVLPVLLGNMPAQDTIHGTTQMTVHWLMLCSLLADYKFQRNWCFHLQGVNAYSEVRASMFSWYVGNHLLDQCHTILWTFVKFAFHSTFIETPFWAICIIIQDGETHY
jgi:hypothetical protein